MQTMATRWTFKIKLQRLMFVARPGLCRDYLKNRFCGETAYQWQTTRPCCRRELPRDAGHLHRKLAPNPRATQWIETTLKLSSSANMGKLSKTTLHVHQWRIDALSPHGIRGPATKVHDIRRISFDWANPQRCQISSRSDKKCAREISIVERNSAPRQSRPKFTLEH